MKRIVTTSKQLYIIKPIRFIKKNGYEAWDAVTAYSYFSYNIYFSQEYRKYCLFNFPNQMFETLEQAKKWANNHHKKQIEVNLTKVKTKSDYGID